MRISDIHSGFHAFVAYGACQGLDVHAIVESIGREGMAHGVKRHVLDFAKEYGLTEELKALDQMKWVQLANHIVKSAQEIVESELIYL